MGRKVGSKDNKSLLFEQRPQPLDYMLTHASVQNEGSSSTFG